MKMYSIFCNGFKGSHAVFRSKEGDYYLGGARLTPLLFSSKKEAFIELAKIGKRDKAFRKYCFVDYARIVKH